MVEAFGILREHGVQVLTVGQYLRPTESHLARGALLAPGRVRGAGARGVRARLRVGRRPARWCGARTTRTSRCRSLTPRSRSAGSRRSSRPSTRTVSSATAQRARSALADVERETAVRSVDACLIRFARRAAAEGQHPDAALPDPHGRADRPQRGRVRDRADLVPGRRVGLRPGGTARGLRVRRGADRARRDPLPGDPSGQGMRPRSDPDGGRTSSARARPSIARPRPPAGSCRSTTLPGG